MTVGASRLAALRTHAAPRFLLVGGVSVVVDIGGLALLHGGLGVPVIPATAAAFAVASLVNFALNRSWTFAAGGGRTRGQLVRFYALVAVNLALTVGLVAGLTAAGLFYLAAKGVATAVVAAFNYVAYRRWVFADRPAGAVGRRWFRSLAAGVLTFLAAGLISTPVIAYQVHHSPVISPIDEVTYIDYLAKVHHGHLIVGEGETDGAYADHQVQCRGIGNAGIDATGYLIRPNPAACAGAPHPPLRLRDTADIDPPTYYLLTDLGARAVLATGITHDLVTAGRLVGIFWAGLGLSLLFGLSRLLGARRAPAALICLAALVTSGLWTNWTHITPHAPDVAVGAAATLTVLLWYRRRAPAWLLPLVGLVPVAVKASDATVVAAAVLFGLVAALLTRLAPTDDPAARRAESRRLLLGAALVLAGIAVGTAGWLLIRRHYALTTAPSFPQFDVTSFRLSYLLAQVGDFLQPVQTAVGSILTFWAFGSVVRYASDRTAALERRALAVTLVAVLAFGAWLYVVSNYVLLHQYVGIPSRYGLTVLPPALALGAVNLRSRWAQAAGVVITALLALETFHPSLR